MTDNIAGILLAAGQSSRFGSHKLLHTLPQQQIPMAVQAAKSLLEVLPDSVAVVRPDDVELKNLLAPTGIKLVDNPQAQSGMSSSIWCGIEALGQNNNGWVIALADMPYIPAFVILQVADAIKRGAMICAPQIDGQRGHPVGFSSQLRNELLALQGDNGARSVVENHHSQLQLIDVTSNTIFHDIDYPEDLA